jgi:hypothetical protein
MTRFGAAEQAISTLFLLSPHPDRVCERLLTTAAAQWLALGTPSATISSTAMSKFFFLLGHVALKMLVYIEFLESRVKQLRSRRAGGAASASAAAATVGGRADDDDEDEEDNQEECKTARPKSKAAASKPKRGAAKAVVYAEDEDEEDGMDEEDDDDEAYKKKSKAKCKKVMAATSRGKKTAAVAATAAAEPSETADLADEMGMAGTDDYELELQREQADASLLAATQLLGRFMPLTVMVLKQPTKFPDLALQRSAVLALCKCMVIHPDVCEAHLPILFTLLEQFPNPTVRSNIIIALGDIAFRFPNLVDPWTSKLYAPLKDKAQPRVRKNALMVLTHLILNDMIKVKGEICEMAVCTEDADPRIAALAKLFFHELAKKGKNPVYNILPDTLSRLSAAPEVTPALFQSVLRFLLQFIDKDKQTESLIEKICQRMLAASDVKGMRDFAYCLSQVCVSVCDM